MTRATTGALLLTSLLAASCASEAPPPEATVASTEGERLYREHCVSCHGPTGAGNGPRASETAARPADLRHLAGPDAEFPTEAVIAVVDGRHVLRGHGGLDMPVWGITLRERGSDQAQDAQVRHRLQAIVAHLETLQVE